MKKLIFLFVMIFTVSTVVGQNTTKVLSEGNDNSVNIDQIKGKNYAEVTQTEHSQEAGELATGNKAFVWQGNGVGNESFINQLSSRESKITITQHNNSNNNWAEANMLKKAGTKGEVQIDQWGDKNKAKTVNYNSGLADIDQKGFKNNAEVVSQVHGWAGKLIARVEQDGDRNDAKVSQSSEKINLVDLYQKGNRNEAVINQKGWGHPGDKVGSKILAEQRGDKNDLTIEQSTGAGVRGSYFNLKQTDGSYANVLQTGGEGLDVKGVGSNQGLQDGGWLDLTQGGNDQLLRIDQTGGSATVDMSGMNNTVQVVQN